MMGRYGCRFLLIDRMHLRGQWTLVGLTDEARPKANASIHRFFSTEAAVLKSIPGFTLIYRSPDQLYDLFRLYEVSPLPEP